MNPGAQSPNHNFEAKSFKNSTPNEISELSRTAFHVMKTAVYNAEIGLKAQLDRAQPAPRPTFIPVPASLEMVEHTAAPIESRPAAPQAPLAEVVDFEAYRQRNNAVQPAEVPTQPEQPTILDEDQQDPAFLDKLQADSQSTESRIADARQEVNQALGLTSYDQTTQEEYPHAA
jgi:hypothetical protein